MQTSRPTTPTTTPTAAQAAAKTKNLGIGALVLKLFLMVLILIIVGVAGSGVSSSTGAKQIKALEEARKEFEKDYTNVGLEWSPAHEDVVGSERTGMMVSSFPLLIILISSILQCVVFCYKGRNTAFKVILFGDALICIFGFALLMGGGPMLIYGSGKHCKEQEILKMTLTKAATKAGGSEEDVTSRFEELMKKPPFGNETGNLYDSVRKSYGKTDKADLLKWTCTVHFENVSDPSHSILLKYKDKCSDRWGTTAKIIAGVIGILTGLAFLVVSVLSCVQVTSSTPTPQNAAGSQQGAYQQGGGSMPGFSPNYNNPPPPYHSQGYQPPFGGPQASPSYASSHPSQNQFQGGPQASPSYVAAHPSQYQFEGGYQGQGPQGPPGYGPSQSQQGYQPQGGQYQQGYQNQGYQQSQQGYQNQQGPPQHQPQGYNQPQGEQYQQQQGYQNQPGGPGGPGGPPRGPGGPPGRGQ